MWVWREVLLGMQVWESLLEGDIWTVIHKVKNQIYTGMEGSIFLLKTKNMSNVKWKGPWKGPNYILRGKGDGEWEVECWAEPDW